MVPTLALIVGEEFVVKHLADSLACANFPEFQQAKRICDLGTGAGFPGVPLAIYSPEKTFVLVDSLAKRLRAVGEMTDAIGLENIYLDHDRAEDAGQGKAFRESFDLVMSRAVADLAVLAEYCLPLVRPGGSFLAYKGSGAEAEIEGAETAIRLLGGKLIRTVDVSAAGMHHTILVIRKERNTPKKYPRKAGTPSKMPIR